MFDHWISCFFDVYTRHLQHGTPPHNNPPRRSLMVSRIAHKKPAVDQKSFTSPRPCQSYHCLRQHVEPPGVMWNSLGKNWGFCDFKPRDPQASAGRERCKWCSFDIISFYVLLTYSYIIDIILIQYMYIYINDFNLKACVAYIYKYLYNRLPPEREDRVLHDM